MSNLTVIVFEDEQGAGNLREAIRKGEKRQHITVEDAAVVVKDSAGKIHVKHQVDRGVKTGAIGGSLLGLLLGSIFFPLAGLITGAIGGAIVGKLAGVGIESQFADEVADALAPGTSALFIISRDSNLAYVRAMLKSHQGQIYHTTLDSEVEEELQAALRQSA